MTEFMRIRILFTTVLLLCAFTSVWSMALTTFGKSNPQNQNPTPPPTSVGKARECKTQSNCEGIRNTFCMIHPQDNIMRCLCGDYSAPDNGLCKNKIQAVGAPCNTDSECTEGAQCVNANNTLSIKRCYCKEGYFEDNKMCNGASTTLGISTFTLFTIFLIFGRSNI
ncbi:uncharacterized protein LOC127279191 [Leptopilina boulardi]|uniref:uncharacterized protein LOC127279191 n=1 Tax=Leptopilina boulardi TaxID=63433 RepID=UPI0021F54B89|nr:uncharacterized protein LOC127279191 [Leptopilina boulardi]